MSARNDVVPAVSVLMPVYNARPFLDASIRSILNQTWTNFEFIIVDDGSTDGSATVLEGYAGRDCRIRLVSQANQGIVGALNNGLDAVRAPLVARMDADDISAPERLALQVAYMEAHPPCVALGGRMQTMCRRGVPLQHWVAPPRTHEDIVASFRSGDGWALIHGTAMMRTDAVRRTGGYRQEYCHVEDIDLFLRLAEVGELANLDVVLYHCRRHLTSVCFTTRREQADLKRTLLNALAEQQGFRVPPGLTFWEDRPPDTARLLWAWGRNAQRASRPDVMRYYGRALLHQDVRSLKGWFLILRSLLPLSPRRAAGTVKEALQCE